MFSPANAIFVGIGVILIVSALFYFLASTMPRLKVASLGGY
jgi:hypothetical protein